MTVSVIERLETAFDAISARNQDLAIVTALDAENALRAAEESDTRQARGLSLGPLDGLVLGIKDNVSVKGLPWTGGLGARRGLAAEADAVVVARLRAAGAIPLAMLNMHEGALGATTNNPYFGRTRNPLDPDRTPGGSSGGSGAAIAAGFSDITLGTDTMGSVRIPAAYCGIAGLKPTRGLVPRTGLLYLSPTLDTIGPLAGDVATLREMIAFMAGADAGDPHALTTPRSWDPRLQDIGGGLRIGIPRQIAAVDCEPDILRGLDSARCAAEALGWQISDVDLAGWDPGRARRGGLLVSEAEGAVEMADILASPDSDHMSDDLRALLNYGKNLSSGWLAEGYARTLAAASAAERALADVDLLLLPTTPQRAFRHNEEIPVNQADFTSLANFHGGPALALPVAGETLPVSIQIMGRAFSEPLVLVAGCALEKKLST